MQQSCKHEIGPVSAFGLAEHQAVDPKNFHCRVQELERVAFGAVAALLTVESIKPDSASPAQVSIQGGRSAGITA
jgi:hypothetical protein